MVMINACKNINIAPNRYVQAVKLMGRCAHFNRCVSTASFENTIFFAAKHRESSIHSSLPTIFLRKLCYLLRLMMMRYHFFCSKIYNESTSRDCKMPIVFSQPAYTIRESLALLHESCGGFRCKKLRQIEKWTQVLWVEIRKRCQHLRCTGPR